MIELTAVTEPVFIRCPYCDFPALVVGPHTTQLVGSGVWIYDSDTLPSVLRQTKGQYLSLCAASRPCCDQSYLLVAAVFVDAEPEWGSAFTETFFCENLPRGPATNFMASRGKKPWLVERYESDLGPVLAHSIGPIALEPAWHGELSLASCNADDPPWHVGRQIVLDLWDDLLALQQAAGR